MAKQKKISINVSNNIFFKSGPIVLGLCLIIIVIILQVFTGIQKLESDIKSYENHIKSRMQDDVSNALAMTSLYYTNNKEYLSNDEIIFGIQEILQNLNSSDVGYFFATDYEGNVIEGPGKGTNRYEAEDKNGLKVVQELISVSKNGGGYVEYVMPDIDGIEQAPKISYVLPFEPYGWYIGAGVPMSDINEMVSEFRQQTIRESIKTIIFLGAAVILILIVLSNLNQKFYRQIETEIKMIKNLLNSPAGYIKDFDTDSYHYIELEQIGFHTHRLIKSQYENQALLAKQVEEIKETASELKTANLSLQDEIEEHAHSLVLLKESQKRFESIVNTIPDVIIIFDMNGKFLDFSLSENSWFSVEESSLICKGIFDLLPLNIAQDCLLKIKLAIDSDEMQLYEYDLIENDEISSFEIRFIKYKEDQVFSILRNTTEFKKAQRNYEYLSFHDQLTSTYNRRYFDDSLLRLDEEEFLPLSIAMIDVNGLKLTNDAFGHQIGDEMLRIIAQILESVCNGNDFVSRIGGDEFAIVCPKRNVEEMANMVTDIYNKIEAEKIHHTILSISLGFAVKNNIKQSIREVIKKAEEHMYSKKIVESQSMRNQTVQVIINTLNEKNANEKIHSEKVGNICGLIGKAMNLDYFSIKELETAGLLHDIGKISINENILNKEGKLTGYEYNLIKKHPESSYQILKSIDNYAGLAEDVLSHHERWDGKGYPRGLSGSEISMIARVISIADAYEAMTADRSYRKAMSKREAMDELNIHSGTQFDPAIIKIFEDKVFDLL